MAETDESTIRTTVHEPTAHDGTAWNVDPDVWALATDGEYATEWAIERTDETVVLVETVRKKGERREPDGQPIAFDVDPDVETADWAAQYADRNPAKKVAAARRFFGA